MIINRGNTCYLGSVLQCLIHTPSLQRYFNCLPNQTEPLAAAFMALLRSVRKDILTDPEPLYSLVRKEYPFFNNGEHHDAHEALMVLLDLLSKSLVKVPCTMFRGDRSARSAWSPNREYNIIDEIFKIMYKIDYQCACGHELIVYETDYCVYDQNPWVCTPEDYLCDRCQRPGTTVRRQQVIHFPQTLIVVHTTSSYKQQVFLGNYTYHLYATVHHLKFDERTGHYFSCLFGKECTMMMDDIHKRVVPEAPKQAYLSFCERN